AAYHPAAPPPINPLVAQLAGAAAERYAADVGTRVPLAALHQAPERARLAKELAKDRAYHLDVVSASNAHTVTRLNDAFQKKGVTLLVDGNAGAGLKKKAKASYVVYAEDIRPEELAEVLGQLGADDKGTPRGTPRALLNTMNDDDRKHLSMLLGVKLEPEL